MKSTFRGERLTNAMSELLRGLFLQALPKSVKLHLVAETNLTLDNLAIKQTQFFLNYFQITFLQLLLQNLYLQLVPQIIVLVPTALILEMFPICAGII